MERMVLVAVLLAVALVFSLAFSASLYGKYSWLEARYKDLLAKYKDLNAKYEEKAKIAESASSRLSTLEQELKNKEERIAELENQISALKSYSSGISWQDWDRLNKAYTDLSSKLYKLEQSYRKVLKAWCPIMTNSTVYCEYYPEECQKTGTGQVQVSVGLLPAECTEPYYP